MRSFVFSKEECQFIYDNYKGISTAELTKELNDKFGTNYQDKQVFSFKKNRKLRSGIDTRFKKGCESWIKGKHICYPGCEKNWFKKGSKPFNTLPVGTLITRTDGLLQRKIADPDVWMLENRRVWQEAYGPIDDDTFITFLDGNVKNCSLENLCAITRGEHAQLNTLKLRSEDPEITKCSISLVRLKNTIKEKQNEGSRCRKTKRSIKNNMG